MLLIRAADTAERLDPPPDVIGPSVGQPVHREGSVAFRGRLHVGGRDTRKRSGRQALDAGAVGSIGDGETERLDPRAQRVGAGEVAVPAELLPLPDERRDVVGN